ncbi:MAG TPA: type III pantothenate kinase [Candidatus Baltobacteraceae bacterium]|nr:type III pantothenate kinase [Candidatus Baltobacteraceae bacterium]
MLLVIDVGNTETKLGCFNDGAQTLVHHWRVTTESRRTADEYGVFFTQLFATAGVRSREIDAVAIASVVPRLDHTLVDVCEKFFSLTPRMLEAQRQRLIAVKTDRPEEVGADLIATAIGGRERHGVPLILVSYGTATVFMAISAQADYLGVAIAPGINISIDALIGRTAKLPQIALDAPAHTIGRNTIEALQSGIIYGFVGQTEAIVARIRAEMGVEAAVVATGGLAEVVAKHTTIFNAVDPHLSLYGLRAFARD